MLLLYLKFQCIHLVYYLIRYLHQLVHKTYYFLLTLFLMLYMYQNHHLLQNILYHQHNFSLIFSNSSIISIARILGPLILYQQENQQKCIKSTIFFIKFSNHVRHNMHNVRIFLNNKFLCNFNGIYLRHFSSIISS